MFYENSWKIPGKFLENSWKIFLVFYNATLTQRHFNTTPKMSGGVVERVPVDLRDAEALSVFLEESPFRENRVYSLGLKSMGGIGITNDTDSYDDACCRLVRFGKTQLPQDFVFTSIYVNYNAHTSRNTSCHIDSHNIGTSALITFGNYDGGQLAIPGHGFFDPRHAFLLFEATKNYHFAQEWTGQRIAITYYVNNSLNALTREQHGELSKYGFPIPHYSSRINVDFAYKVKELLDNSKTIIDGRVGKIAKIEENIAKYRKEILEKEISLQSAQAALAAENALVEEEKLRSLKIISAKKEEELPQIAEEDIEDIEDIDNNIDDDEDQPSSQLQSIISSISDMSSNTASLPFFSQQVPAKRARKKTNIYSPTMQKDSSTPGEFVRKTL